MRKRDIHLGQRFLSDTGLVWEVKRITALEKAPNHVVIVSVNDPTTSKIISEKVLSEPRRFQPSQ
jgi:hypothetical protein